MITSGVEELDRRLGGGLAEGRFYLLSGSPGSGKTTACLHFLGEALAADEPCALLTQENPADVLAQAEFAGYDFLEQVRDGRLALLQYRLDFAQNYARIAQPERVADEFVRHMEGARPRRIVIDTILPLLDAGGGPHGAVNALLHLLERFSATAYFTVPGDISDSYYARAYDMITSGGAGILSFSNEADGARLIEVRKCRHLSQDTTPLRFGLRAGAGLVPVRGAHAVLDSEQARRIILLDTHEGVAEETESALRGMYEVQRFESLEDAFGELAGGRFGLLLVTLDIHDANRQFDFVRSLRAAGSGAPILLLAPAQGLRGSTRARGLRAGVDDFLDEDISPQELLARVEAARRRGHQPSLQATTREVQEMQPRAENGTPRPLDEPELAAAVRRHIEATAHPFFALVEVRGAPEHGQRLWDRLCSGLRLGDGDLIARRGQTGFTLYVHDVGRRRVQELLARVFDDNEALLPDQTVYGYPADRVPIQEWLERAGRSAHAESA